MNSNRWEKIEKLFNTTLALPPLERELFLDAETGADADLRREVDSLLREVEQPDDFLSQPALTLATRLLAQDPMGSFGDHVFATYTVLRSLGHGGMGDVFLAEEARLGRLVALKILPASLTGNSESALRFHQEARAASAISHPNVAHIYEFGQVEDRYYLAMEYVEGKTLRELLEEKAIDSHQALDIALQVGQALQAAHQSGVVHRDIKPENIMLRRDGYVKVLDFGLAKITNRNGWQSETDGKWVSPLDTTPGVIMGTPAYMSPEQVRGQAIDHRTDIFSFGSIFYEMLTGKRAFRGESSVETMNAILKEDPPELSEINGNINPSTSRIVRRCLEKNPEDRFQSANDLAFALEVLSGSTETSGQMVAPRVPVKTKNLERVIWVVLVGILFVGLAFLYFWRLQAKTYAVRFSVSLPEKTSRITSLSISPDGRRIAFIATIDGKVLIWLRAVDSLTAQPLAGTDTALNLFWSPDSRFIAFFADGKLKKVEATGGLIETLCDAPYGRGGTWNRNGTIVFSPQAFAGLYRVSASGGVPTQITTLDQTAAENSHRWPHFLPDGHHFVFFVRSEKAEKSGICVASLDSNDRTFLLPSESSAAYSSPGYLLFLREKTLMAQRFDDVRLKVTGEPFSVAEDIGYARNLNEQQGYFSVSENGVLAYSEGSKDDRCYAWFDRAGKELGTLALAGDVRDMALSPDGKRVAVQFIDNKNNSANEDIWLIDLERNIASRFTFGTAADDFPVWSPDGHRLAFNSFRVGQADIYQSPYNGAGNEELLLRSDTNKNPTDWSSDGRFILYENITSKTKCDLWVLPLFGDRKPFPFLVTDFNQSQAHWSPDGRWIAYVSDESGLNEVYVRNFPITGEKLLVSSGGGGMQPIWRRDGKELFYIAPNGRLMAVEIRAGPTLEATVPRVLFETRVDNYPASNRYAVSADGRRFLINSPTEQAAPKPITVVLDWNIGLKQ